MCLFMDLFYMFSDGFTCFSRNQVASVCGRTMEWRSLPTTRATEPLHLMWLLQTQSDLSAMPPRIRWHAILRTPPLVGQGRSFDHFSCQLQCKKNIKRRLHLIMMDHDRLHMSRPTGWAMICQETVVFFSRFRI